MKLLGISGSPRKGATENVMQTAIQLAQSEGAETELILLRNYTFQPCVQCDACIKTKALNCLRFHDEIDSLIQKFISADVCLIGSPVYCMGTTPLLSAFFSRMRWNYTLIESDRDYFFRKVGAAIAVGGTRNGGQEFTISAINAFFASKGMTIATGGRGIYEGVAIWSQNQKDDLKQHDPIGMENLKFFISKLVKLSKIISK